MKISITKYSLFISTLLLTAEIINNSIATIIFPIPGSLLQASIYGSMLLVLVLAFRHVRVNLRMLLVVIAAGMSLIINTVEAKYNAPFRLGSWILLLASVGPLLYSQTLIKFREDLLENTFTVFMWIAGISFVYWLSGIPSLGRGHFSGLMNHSMVLAPVAALGGFYALYRFTIETRKKQRYLYLALFLASGIDVVLAASRTSLLAFSAGFLTFLVFSKFRFRKTIIATLIIFTIGMSSTMDDLDQSSATVQSGSVTSEMMSRGLQNTRESLWNDRILEFKSSPIFGVGFATQNDNIKGKTGKEGGRLGGKVEPGSTYLMVLSMTGLVGAITIMLFIVKGLLSKSFWRRIASERYKMAAFAFFTIHFVAEGYLYSSGAFLAFAFWLLVGATYPYPGLKYKKVLDQP